MVGSVFFVHNLAFDSASIANMLYANEHFVSFRLFIFSNDRTNDDGTSKRASELADWLASNGKMNIFHKTQSALAYLPLHSIKRDFKENNVNQAS